MQTVIEFAPWVIFFVVYKLGGGIYPATAALMGAMALLLAYDWLTTRKVPQMHLVLAILVWVFGAATLLLHDVRFLQWKASAFYWIAGLLFAGSAWVGQRTLLERLLAKGLPEDAVIPAANWRAGSIAMGVFYLLLGGANIWVALNRSESDWVTFKVWIASPAGVVFTLLVIFWVLRPVLAQKDAAA